MIATYVIKRLIREEKIYEIPANMELGSREGMQTLDQALADLVRSGIVTQEEAVMKTSNPVKLNELLRIQQESSRFQTSGEAMALHNPV